MIFEESTVARPRFAYPQMKQSWRGVPRTASRFRPWTALAALAIALVLGCTDRAAPPTHPSDARAPIVLLVLDTVRADAIGDATAPALAALEREALSYSQARSTAPLTMPSMAALMTGREAHRTGILGHSRRDRLSGSDPLLAEIARSAGYRTAAVVTNPWLASPQTGFSRGFESFVSGRTLGRKRTRLTAEEVVDLGLRELGTKDSRPLFLWLHFMDAHMPYADGESATAVTRDFVTGFEARSRIFFEAPYSRTEIDATIAAYRRAVGKIDVQIGRLLEAVPEQAVVIVVSDHGESLGEHGLHFAHDFTLYDELLRVPLFVRAPDLPGARIDTPVSLLDLMPTVCVLANLECPSELEGRVLPGVLPTLGGVDVSLAAENRTFFFASTPVRNRYRCPWITVPGPKGRLTAAVKDGRKLIRIPQRDGPIEYRAFDLRSDPGETLDRFDSRRDGDLARVLDAWSIASAAAPIASRARLPPGVAHELRALGYLE
jgi:arylsulfatase A-like enzyme